MGGGSKEELKMLSKNTCERVHLIAKLPAISLQASKTSSHIFFKDFSQILSYYLLCFSRSYFMEGCFMFQWGERVVFQIGGLIFR